MGWCAPGWGWPTSSAISWPACGPAPARCSGQSTRGSRWRFCVAIRPRVDARGLGEARLQAFLKRHGYTGRKPARELLSRLRAGAEGRAGQLETEVRRQIVLALVSALEPIVERISELTIEIRHALHAHPDGDTFRSLFIAPDSWLCAATMLAEIGDCRDRYPSYRALAADAG